MYFVNQNQTKEERAWKYRTLRSFGYCHKQAIRIRDWSWYHFTLVLVNKPEFVMVEK